MAILLPNHTLEEIPDLLFTELRKGSAQKKHPFRNVVLSTLNQESARSRWVVFRKLTQENHFLIYTDARSEKVAELKENQNCSLLFYHNRQGLQIRLNGRAQIHHDNEWTRKYWPGVQGSAIKSYTSLSAPGSPIHTIEEGYHWTETPSDQYFNIIEFSPNEIDVLQLDRDGHIRAVFQNVEDTWKGTFVAP